MNRKSRLYYGYRIFKWRVLKDKSPIVSALKITQRCNLKCTHCSWRNKIIKDLTLIEWENIIDDLYKKGVTTIVIEGGEPTLHKDAPRIVEYIKSKNMYSIFITNGTQDIYNINPDVFWISVEGMEKSNDKIRGNGVFEKIMHTLKKNSGKKFISLTTISKRNAEEIESMCRYFSDCNLFYGMMFNFLYPYTGIEDSSLDTKERIKTAEKIIELKKKYPKIMNSVSYLKTVGKEKRCYPWLLVSVTADGKQRNDCMIRHIENDDCSKCDLACYGELSRMYDFKVDTAEFWSKNFGFPKFPF